MLPGNRKLFLVVDGLRDRKNTAVHIEAVTNPCVDGQKFSFSTKFNNFSGFFLTVKVLTDQ